MAELVGAGEPVVPCVEPDNVLCRDEIPVSLEFRVIAAALEVNGQYASSDYFLFLL
ncbi:MAG: hypothetical protein U5N86_09875 [Planctomycetota bacterium]|nr:hypothetical protein [Planctomycetota bacterium]